VKKEKTMFEMRGGPGGEGISKQRRTSFIVFLPVRRGGDDRARESSATLEREFGDETRKVVIVSPLEKKRV